MPIVAAGLRPFDRGRQTPLLFHIRCRL